MEPRNLQSLSRLPDNECPRGMVVKTLPEDRLIRKAVVQGIGRLLRDVYDQDAVGPVPDHIAQSLARLDTVKPSGTRETRIR